MIFKTYETDLDGISNKLGFSKRSFAEWGKQVSTSFKESEGFINKFKNTLQSMFVVQSKDSIDWRRTISGDIVSKDNIDDFIPKFNTDSARIELENLQKIQNKINETKGSWDDYNNEFKDGREYLLNYAKSNNVLEASVDDIKEVNQQARASALAHNEAIKAQTFSAKAGAVALKALSIAGNMLAMWAITKGIELVVKGFDNWIHRVEKANEAMQNAVGEYESAKSSLKNVNSELEEQNKQLDELLAKDKLTYAEKGQLEKLQAITKELMLQQNIEEKRADNASKEAANKAVDAYNKQYGKFDITQEALDEKISYGYDSLPMIEGENDIVSIIFAYIRANELLKQAQTDYENALANGEDTTTLADDIQNDIDAVDIYTQALNTSVSDLQEKRAALEDEYNKVIKKRESGLEPLTSSEQNVIRTYESIYDAIKLVYKYTDQNMWNNMEVSNIFNTKGLEKTKEELIAMTKAGELSPETLQALPKLSAAIKDSELIVEEGSNAFTEFYNELVALANKQEEMVRDTTKESFTETISQVQSLSTGLEKLGKIYTDVKNQEAFDWSSILNNEEFANTFGSMGSTYDNFIKIVSNAPDDIEACQSAFDKLATSYIYNTKDANGNNIMDNLTRSTKDATVAMLEQMGVVNALELVEAELSKKEEALEVQRIYASEHTTELADATLKQANAYITEADCSEIARKYLAQLYLQKNLSNKTVVSTAADCQNLIELAKTAGYSQSVLLKLENLKQKFAKGERILSRESLIDINDTIKNIFSEAEADIGGTDFEVKFDSGDIENSASSVAQSFTDLLDKELTFLDKKMEAGYIDFNDYIQARLALIEDYYSQGKIKADEYYSYLENHYKQELSYRDKVINAVTRRIDKEIKSLEKEKDAIEENYHLQIDALENQKTLLEDANKERQRQIDLQKALYELERAKNQRTKLVYSEGGGMHYVADDTAIRDAENEAENARQEIQISEIEKSITLLEKSRDAETEAIDDMIGKLQEYKEKWNDISSAYEEEQEDLIAAQMLGQEWEEDIINCRLDVLNQFKDDYADIQQSIIDKAWESANEQIKAAQEAAKGADGVMGGSGKIGDTTEYEVVYTLTGQSVAKFGSQAEAESYANSMSMGIPEGEHIYYTRKYHTGLQQGTVNAHSFHDDFKLVQEVGLGNKEVPAILKEGEAVATPAQISNIAAGLRTADSIHSVQAERPYFAVEQERLEQCAALLGRSIDEILFPTGMMSHGMPFHSMERMTGMDRLSNPLINAADNNNNAQPVVNQYNTLNCPNVTNNSGVEYLQKELGHLSLMAMQEAMKRH